MGTIQLNKKLYLNIGISLLTFAIFIYFGKFIAEAGNCWGGFGEDCWSRWDSALYIDVAQHGHNLIHCSDYPSDWCGNAGWAPAYPLLIRILHFISPTVPMIIIGLYLSHFFVLCSLIFIAITFRTTTWYRHFMICLVFIFAPGNIYLHAIFPLSMLVFLLQLCFYQLQKSQFFIAGIFAFFAVLTYSIGFVLILALAIWYLYDLWKIQKFKPHFAKTSLVVLPIFALFTWFLYDQIVTGHWNALFLIQAKYGHSINTPWKYMGIRFHEMISNYGKREMWMEIQNFVLWFFVLFACFEFYKLRGNNTLWVFYICFTFLFLAVPYSTSAITAIYRNAVVLIPAWLILANHISLRRVGISICVFAIMAYPLGILFIQSILK